VKRLVCDPTNPNQAVDIESDSLDMNQSVSSVPTLAQSGSAAGSTFFWVVVLVVVVVIGGFIIFNVRRRILLRDDSASVGSSGLLDHLHALHKAGEIDDEEFARARSSVLMKVQDDLESKLAAKEAAKKGRGSDAKLLEGLDNDLKQHESDS